MVTLIKIFQREYLDMLGTVFHLNYIMNTHKLVGTYFKTTIMKI